MRAYTPQYLEGIPTFGGGLHGFGGSEMGPVVAALIQQAAQGVTRMTADDEGIEVEEADTAAPQGSQQPRVVKGAGGWAYRQDPDGAITVLAVPSAAHQKAMGRRLTSGAAWEAITKEIGPYPVVGEGYTPPTTAGEAAVQAVTSLVNYRRGGGGTDALLEKAQKALVGRAAAAGTAALTATAANLISGAGAAAAASAGGSAAAATAPAVAGLLGSAGAVSSVPVAGWIVAGGLAAAAGAVAIVRGVRKKKARAKDIIAAAKKMGIDIKEAEKVPLFVNRVLKMDQDRRNKVGARLAAALKREQTKPKWLTPFRNEEKLKAKLALLAGIDLWARAEKADKAQAAQAAAEVSGFGFLPGEPAVALPGVNVPPVVEVPAEPFHPREPTSAMPGYVMGPQAYHWRRPAWAEAPVAEGAVSSPF